MFEVAKSATERVKELHERRRKAKICRKQRLSDPPHGKIYKSDMCRPCYEEQLAYNREIRRKRGPGR